MCLFFNMTSKVFKVIFMKSDFREMCLFVKIQRYMKACTLRLHHIIIPFSHIMSNLVILPVFMCADPQTAAVHVVGTKKGRIGGFVCLGVCGGKALWWPVPLAKAKGSRGWLGAEWDWMGENGRTWLVGPKGDYCTIYPFSYTLKLLLGALACLCVIAHECVWTSSMDMNSRTGESSENVFLLNLFELLSAHIKIYRIVHKNCSKWPLGWWKNWFNCIYASWPLTPMCIHCDMQQPTK